KVGGDEGLGEVLGEAALGGKVRDETAAADRRGRLPLAGSGLAEQEGGEILHPVPQRGVIAAHVVSEHVVPERLAQLAHRFTLARERAQDEVERAPQLEKKRQVPPG